MKHLIIVESPTKARTIRQYLDKSYEVLSSQGHVRDLPKNDLGVDIEKGFEPKLVTKRNKRIQELRDAAKSAETIFLATDHDREGEAIAYDLYSILKRVNGNDDAYVRPLFNEITKPAILDALRSPEKVDLNRVEAQRTRRILDRLVGYQISPLLSKAIAGSRFEGLSAGRVQSVALRFLCDREDAISRFVPEEYWEIFAQLSNGESFHAKLAMIAGEKAAVISEKQAEKIASDLAEVKLLVEQLTQTQRRRDPPAPFITSSLQQSASSQLGFSPKRTMRTAQELYEGISLPEGDVGLITYMRTDSVRLAPEAVGAARKVIVELYGDEFLSQKTRTYKNKKRSQDAHEAIRPTDVRRTPESVASQLSPDQLKLYRLIYNRFLATQMATAIFLQKKAVITGGVYTLEATGSERTFDGFLRLYPPPKEREGETSVPASLKQGEKLVLEDVDRRQKFTEPPRRYSEAGLVNLLEKEGIGRPSTYASIISVIQERGYAVRNKSSLRPTLLGHVVVNFLSQFFSDTINPSFTAHMEEDLDRVEEGDLSRLEALKEFYAPFAERLASLEAAMQASEFPFRVMTDVPCPKCGAKMELRYWKGSAFLGCSTYPECRQTRSLPADLPYRFEEGVLIVRDALEHEERHTRQTTRCPKCGGDMEIRSGRFGRYYRCTNPDCGETASVSTHVVCPTCNTGELVEKYSTKRRRTFYSCSNYPACRFAMSDRPVKRCPACEEGVLVEREQGERLQCTRKECGYSESNMLAEASAASEPDDRADQEQDQGQGQDQ